MTAVVAHVVGARPNFIKAAPVIRALHAAGVEQRLIHTGQHYDAALSDVFFAISPAPAGRQPRRGLHPGGPDGGPDGRAEGRRRDRSGPGVVYGDINSTIAASLVAAKIGSPIAHVEAGLRSFDDTMPEEINRRVTDLLSDLLFVTPGGPENLDRAGVDPARVHFVATR
jgi:UDP-N-acetylglucosamine 2-epimerase (non-hydrolysing)